MDEALVEQFVELIKRIGCRNVQKHVAAAMRERSRELRGMGMSIEANSCLLNAGKAQQAVLDMDRIEVSK